MLQTHAHTTHDRTYTRLLRLCLASLLLVTAACGDDKETPNTTAEVLRVDAPESLGGVQLAFTYTLRDLEADDQRVRVEVCAEDGSACGFPFRGVGGDGTEFLPTSPAGAEVPHRFVWAIGCGRVDEKGAIIDTQRDARYVLRVSISGAPSQQAQTEAPFSLADLGFTGLPACTAGEG